MRNVPRVILITMLLVLSVAAVLPVSAGQLLSSAVFQSPTVPPSPLTPTNTPPPPPPTSASTATPLPSTPTNTPTAPGTSAPTATGSPVSTATATSTPSPTVVPPTLPPPSYTIIAYWTVQPGQTLYCIGRYYRVSPWSIAAVNYIPWPYFIYPGQILAIPNSPWYNIPPGPVCYPGVPNVTPIPPPVVTPTPPPVITPTPPAPPVCRYYHYVQWGQTLSSIAWYYGTTIQAIMYANPGITNPNLIYAGSTLCIP